MQISTKYVQASELSAQERESINNLHQECFSDVPQSAIREDFIAEPVGYFFAFTGKEIVGKLDIFIRNITFSGQSIILGGMGGVCVTGSARHHGVASLILKQGLQILYEQNCDIACLNVDPAKTAHKVYEKIGFNMMEREISFEKIHGGIVKDQGTMFIPIRSQAIYDLVMKSNKTFHYGKGYW